MKTNQTKSFNFNVSLSVLDHLGRNLYRTFATVLGEAISNAWDADAENVYISIDKENKKFSIIDDGIGMTADDFQEKFLKVGYSKRKDGTSLSPLKKRPYIGRKGIGKLALLSCADNILIISQAQNSEKIGGVIDNSELDHAISEDNEQYTLKKPSPLEFTATTFSKGHGTYIQFNQIKAEMFHSINYLRRIIALYFRFSIVDSSFKIYVNGEVISNADLNDLIDKTEFVWNLNSTTEDALLEQLSETSKKKCNKCPIDLNFKLDNGDTISGFIASTEKPADLRIKDTDETLTVDLFVNGRLREKDILKHIRSRRVPESYLYGQINYNALDDEIDRFTTSRESIKEEDPKFHEFLLKLKTVLNSVMNNWDELRIGKREDGDPDNTKKITKKERKARELFNVTSKEYQEKESTIKDDVSFWLDELEKEAQFNFPSYAECFIAENLIRHYIKYKDLSLSSRAKEQVADYRTKEKRNKEAAGISISIRKSNDDKSYLDMTELANFVDKGNEKYRLSETSKTYKPPRDAIMHTALVSTEAKRLLTCVLDEIKARIRQLLS